MKQLQLFPKNKIKREHGGHISLGKRRKKRPLSIKTPLHLVLRSDFAYGRRSLLRHRPLIQRVIKKAQKRFRVKIYEQGIVSNHIHLLVQGHSRETLQNFFRVVTGHIAQEILRENPIRQNEKPVPGGAPKSHKRQIQTKAQNVGRESKTRETENKFWETRIYSRIVTWGRDYFAAKQYVIDNALEAMGLIPYLRGKKRKQARFLNANIRRTLQDTS